MLDSKEKMEDYKIEIQNRFEESEHIKPVSKLQIIKYGIIALLILSVAIAVFFAAFIIGLLLILPFALLVMLWFIYMVWRGKLIKAYQSRRE